MKRKKNIQLLSLILLTSLLFNACKHVKFLSNKRNNNNIDFYQKYLGKYQAIDNCDMDSVVYGVVIVAAENNRAKFVIDGFGGFGNPIIKVRCHIINTNTFEIPKATHEDGKMIEGIKTGIYDTQKGEISIGYKVVFENGEIEECDLILTPQQDFLNKKS